MYAVCTGPGRVASSLPIDHTITDGWFSLATMLRLSSLTASRRTDGSRKTSSRTR